MGRLISDRKATNMTAPEYASNWRAVSTLIPRSCRLSLGWGQRTNHAVDAVELGGKEVRVGRLVLSRRRADKGLHWCHGGHSVPGLVEDTVLNSSSRIRAMLGRGNATIPVSQLYHSRHTRRQETHMIRKVTMLIHTARLQNQPRCLRERM